MEIEFDEFTQDLLRPDGSVWIEDVLFIRGTAPIPGGEMVYMAPLFPGLDLDKEILEQIIYMIIERQVADLCLN
jgi:hypothetical protein